MKLLLLLSIGTFLISCKPPGQTTTVASSSKINPQAPYLWPSSSFPLSMRSSNDFSETEFAAIEEMALAWESATDNKINYFNTNQRASEVSSPNLSLDSVGMDGINGIYRITHWPLSLNSSALGVTQIFGRRWNAGTPSEYVEIVHADILVNENIYDFRVGNSGVTGSYSLKSVVLHEMGHFLGLGHKYGNTVMVPSISSSTNFSAPTLVDAADLADRYNVSLNELVGFGITADYTPIHDIPDTDSENGPEATGDDENFTHPNEGEEVRILIELLPSGECIHKENGKVIHTHSVSPEGLK